MTAGSLRRQGHRTTLLVIAVVGLAVAALAAGLLTRSRLPLSRRLAA